MTRQPAFGGERAAECFAILGIAVVEHDIAAVAARRRDLHRRRVFRHDDRRRDVSEPAGERDRLRMVAGRKGENAATALRGVERRDGVARAPEFEGARRAGNSRP